MRPLGNCAAVSRLHSDPHPSPPPSAARTFAPRGCTHFFTARLARVLVAVAGIFELGAAFKVFEDQLVGSATHDRPKRSDFEFRGWR
jgi:hypothetical protein